MDIEIKRLSSDLLEDYLHFFETDAHADNPDEDRCYCVGRCNANEKSKCLNCISRLRFMTNVIIENNKNEKVKSIFCFTIAPNMKRKGIATKLLERVCSDAKSDGCDCIEV